MRPLTKQIVAGVAVAGIMALLYGTTDLVFTAYGAEAAAAQNATDIAETKENTKEAKEAAQAAANAAARIEGQQQAILNALKDIQRRLP